MTRDKTPTNPEMPAVVPAPAPETPATPPYILLGLAEESPGRFVVMEMTLGVNGHIELHPISEPEPRNFAIQHLKVEIQLRIVQGGK